MISFDKIVNKLLKKWWKIIFKNDIFEIIDPELKDIYLDDLNKIIYKLKSQEIIISIRNWVYLIPTKDDKNLNEIDLIEKYYYSLLKKYIQENVWSDYYISWKKSLEIHLKNYSIPETIYIVNRKIDKKVMIWNYKIIFKTVKNTKKNLYASLSKMVLWVNFNEIDFKISNLELSLIENALITDSLEWIDINTLTKTIKKYSKYFNYDNFYTIWELKFVMAFNRLKELSKPIDKKLYELFLDIIKKNWWNFIWEWLRKII